MSCLPRTAACLALAAALVVPLTASTARGEDEAILRLFANSINLNSGVKTNQLTS